VTGLGLAIRWLHLAAGILLIGAFGFLFLVGRRDSPTIRTWERRIVGWTRWAVGILLCSGLAVLSYQAMVVTGKTAEGWNPGALLRLLTATQFGTVWLLRHGLLLLLAALILFRERETSGWDWAAFRGEGVLIGGIGLGLTAWAGHAAAVEPWTFIAALVDAVHVLAAAAWLGGLGPLALLLYATLREGGAEARPFAVIAARRFSAMAFLAMCTLAATGIWNSWNQIGNLSSLVGTRHGQLLLIKLALLIPILALAAINRRRLLPALSGDAETTGRPAMARLARFVGIELGLGLTILLVVAVMVVTPPGRHTQPWWPLSFRFLSETNADFPGFKWRLLVGSQLALVGLLGLIVAWLIERRRRIVIGAGAALFIAGLLVALPPLSIDAYPTTYRRTPVPYQAISIATGGQLYAGHCASCHGVAGHGDGPRAGELPNPPTNLTGRHTLRHTAGDLFWWITNGFSGSPEHAFKGRLSDEERWDLVNFVRTLGSAEQAGTLASVVEPDRPRIVAPDFAFQTGPGPGRTLKDWRGRRVVLLVHFTLPQSRPRLSLIAQNYDILQAMGAEVLAVPMDEGREILTRLGANPRILFPVAVEGGGEIVATYSLFSRTRSRNGPPPSHLEFLIDRQGYLRARWIPDGKGWTELSGLLAEIQQLNQEKLVAPTPDEHVH
jgi:putative copper resistance protein D